MQIGVLQIWGNGALRDELSAQINQCGLQGKVMLMGYSDDVMDKMSQASVFALSSRSEGFGLVILEAMSVGLPIVSYACPAGPKDLIDDTEDGFLIDNGDEDMFAEKICYLIEHEEERVRMGKNAIMKSEKYSIEAVMKRWIEFFDSLKGTIR